MLDNIYYYIFLAIIFISLGVFIVKRGIHVLCLIVAYSYISFFFVYNISAAGVEYLSWDVLRLASISVILLLISCKSQSAKPYFFYSIIILIQMVINSISMTGLLTVKSFDNISMVLAVLELMVFFNGIHRTITANNGRESSGRFTGFISNFSYRYRYRPNSSNNSIQKGSQR